MKKRSVLIVAAAAAAVILTIVLLLTVKGKDRMNVFERINAKQLLGDQIFLDNETGETVIPKVVAAIGSEGSAPNTFLGSKTQLKSGADMIELRMVSSEGVAYLGADSAEITEKSAKAVRVVREMTAEYPDAGIMAKLGKVDKPDDVFALLLLSNVGGGCYVTGVGKEELDDLHKTYPSVSLVCDYTSRKLSLQEIKDSGAVGIRCKGSMVNDTFIKNAKSNGLTVWADCGDDVYLMVKMLAYGADYVVTDYPTLARSLCDGPSVEQIDNYFSLPFIKN